MHCSNIVQRLYVTTTAAVVVCIVITISPLPKFYALPGRIAVQVPEVKQKSRETQKLDFTVVIQNGER